GEGRHGLALGVLADGLDDGARQGGRGGSDARGLAHWKIPAPEARTPAEERVRRRAVPPWGSGGALVARCVRGLGGMRTHLPRASWPRQSLDRKRRFKVKALQVGFRRPLVWLAEALDVEASGAWPAGLFLSCSGSPSAE